MIKVIKVRATEKQMKNDQKFMTFKGQKTDGTFVQFKFNKEVENLPKKNGIYNFTIETANMQKTNTDFGECYWINKIESFEAVKLEDYAANEF